MADEGGRNIPKWERWGKHRIAKFGTLNKKTHLGKMTEKKNLEKKGNVRLSEKDKEFIKTHINDMTQAELTRALGCHMSTIIYYVRKFALKKKSGQGCKWNLDNAKEFKAMYCGGASMEEIARHFNISVNSVQSARKRIIQLHGLEIKRKHKADYAIAY